jgi:hypothetical protein
MNNALRISQLSGCSGFLRFDKNSNERAFSGFFLTQMQPDDDGDGLKEVFVAEINPFSANRYTAVNNLTWPYGKSQPPPDTRVDDKDCGYPDNENSTSS